MATEQPSVEDLKLDLTKNYGFTEELKESERVIATHERTALRYPSEPPPGYASWRELFDQTKAAKTVVPETVKTVLQPATAVDPSVMPAKPKKVAAWCEEFGWHVQAAQSIVHTSAVYRKADSDEKDSEGSPVKSKGELMKEPVTETYNWVSAALKPGPKLVALFTASWAEGRFQSAHIQFDHFGRTEEIWVNYEALDQREEYNDSSAVLVKSFWLEKVGDFEEWLDQWAAMLQAPQFTKPKPAPKEEGASDE